MRARGAARGARRRRRPDDRVRPGRRGQHGAFDPLEPIVRRRRRARGLAPRRRRLRPVGRGEPARRPLVAGLERADCWATDAHKWLNVPYDAGLAFVAAPARRTARRSAPAPPTCHRRRATRWTGRRSPRAARALRDLGRAALARARRASPSWSSAAARARGASPRCSAPRTGVEVLNEVVLNQVLVRFGDDDAVTDAVVAAVQAEGTCWMGPTTWHGRRAMRISVSNWATTSATSIARAQRSSPRARGGGPGGTAAVPTVSCGFSASWR